MIRFTPPTHPLPPTPQSRPYVLLVDRGLSARRISNVPALRAAIAAVIAAHPDPRARLLTIRDWRPGKVAHVCVRVKKTGGWGELWSSATRATPPPTPCADTPPPTHLPTEPASPYTAHG
eukprot:scaffold27807_cov74-Isochrysis_galbana.AAC.1